MDAYNVPGDTLEGAVALATNTVIDGGIEFGQKVGKVCKFASKNAGEFIQTMFEDKKKEQELAQGQAQEAAATLDDVAPVETKTTENAQTTEKPTNPLEGLFNISTVNIGGNEYTPNYVSPTEQTSSL
ncbi:MAG: hypothetical protein LBQ05_02960 [Christensenellaceae bacterium]|jgi:hypothetical protein|nr:hypothetical protein [Christensenellaceae bacterium]